MRNYLSGLLVASAGLFLPNVAVAQKLLSVVAGGQVHVMQARYVTAKPANLLLNLVPRLYSNFTLGAAVELSPRYAVQATVGRSTYGFSFETQSMGRGKSTFVQEAHEYALVLRRQYPDVGERGHLWFMDAGIDVLHAGRSGVANFTLNHESVDGSRISASGSSISGKSYRMGVRFGAGREWALSEHHHVALGLLASIGVNDLRRYRMQTTGRQQASDVNSVSHDLAIATRFSFVGAQVRYRFQL